MRLTYILLLLLAFSLDATGQSSQSPPAKPPPQEQEISPDDVVRVNTTLVGVPVTVLDRQGRLVPNLKQEDAPLKYSGGWPEYHDNFKKNVAPGFASFTLTPNNDVKVTRRGNLALTTLTFHLSAKQKDGTPLEFDARHTIVWEKRGGQWLIIHEHVSKPLF